MDLGRKQKAFDSQVQLVRFLDLWGDHRMELIEQHRIMMTSRGFLV